MQDSLHDRNADVKYCPDCKKEVDVKEFYFNKARGKYETYCKTHKMLRQSFKNAMKYKTEMELVDKKINEL